MKESVSRSGVIGAGNWIVDIVHVIDHWPNKNDLVRIADKTFGIGGGAANVLSDLHSFGVYFPLIPVGKLGCDSYAGIVLQHCRSAGFPLDFLIQDKKAPTAHTHVMNVPGDSRTFFYQGGANDTFTLDDIPIEQLVKRKAKIFYLGYAMLLEKLDHLQADGSTEMARLLRLVRQADMITIVDLVSAEKPDFKAIMLTALPFIDYLVINETEASRASGISVWDSDGTLNKTKVLVASQFLLDKGVNKAVIVHSPEFALWFEKSKLPIWSIPDPVDAEDIKSPVGAGDAFCAGIIFGTHEEWAVEPTLRLAHQAARAALHGQTATDGIPPLSELVPEYLSLPTIGNDGEI